MALRLEFHEPTLRIQKADGSINEAICLVAEIDRSHVPHAADKERCGSKQYHGQRDLCADQRRAEPGFLITALAQTSLQRSGDVWVCCLNRRQKARGHRG